MAEEKPRIFQGGRDMALSLVLITVIVVAVIVPTGMCSFNPGTPENGPVQEVDAHTFLSLEARAHDFPVREPVLPEGWVPNSARRTAVATVSSPTIGTVTKDGGYLQLTQTSVPAAEAASGFDGRLRHEDESTSIDGVPVTTYVSDDEDVRQLWVADHGDVRILVTGAATPEEFRALIAATLSAPPLPASDEDNAPTEPAR